MIAWFKRRFLRKKEATPKPASNPSAGFSSFGYFPPPPVTHIAPARSGLDRAGDMLLGGMIGHAIGSSHHTPAPEPTQSYTPSPSYDAPRNDYCAPSYDSGWSSSPSSDTGCGGYE